jgi:tetratricopeptide (TPR) repeat protein
VCAREVEGKLQAIQGLAEAARQAEAAGDWEGALKKWQALATQDPAQKAVCEQRANNARYEAFMAQSRACERDGNLEQALVHARAAQPYDSTGGQRAQAQIQALESKVRAREQALAAKGAVETAGALVSRGQVRQAVAALTAAAQANPQDLELANLKTALETVEVIERGYGRLETIRGDAEAAVQTALDADKDDKQVRGWLEQVKAWRVRLTEAAGNPRLAWSERRFETLGPALAGLRSNARDMGQLYTSLSANFAGKAASAAKPKVNVGGFTGGIGGRVFGGVGASADVGDNQKLAAIYDATARTLERCATAARELGAE